MSNITARSPLRTQLNAHSIAFSSYENPVRRTERRKSVNFGPPIGDAPPKLVSRTEKGPLIFLFKTTVFPYEGAPTAT